MTHDITLLLLSDDFYVFIATHFYYSFNIPLKFFLYALPILYIFKHKLFHKYDISFSYRRVWAFTLLGYYYMVI